MSVGMGFPREVRYEVSRALNHVNNSHWQDQQYDARTSEFQYLSLLLVHMLGCRVRKGGKFHDNPLRRDLGRGREYYRNASRESNQMCIPRELFVRYPWST